LFQFLLTASEVKTCNFSCGDMQPVKISMEEAVGFRCRARGDVDCNHDQRHQHTTAAGAGGTKPPPYVLERF